MNAETGRIFTVCGLLLFLMACGSGPKKPPKQDPIQVADFLATPDNCGMIHYVAPAYPKEAKRAHVEGIVKFAVLIAKTGTVGKLDLLSGNPALVDAATQAVKQWRYAPCRLNGQPVEIKTQIDVSFTLGQ